MLGEGGSGELALKPRQISLCDGQGRFGLSENLRDGFGQACKTADEADGIALLAKGKILAPPIGQLALGEDGKLQASPDRLKAALRAKPRNSPIGSRRDGLSECLAPRRSR